MSFWNVNPFSWIFNTISSEKSCLISKLFLTRLLDVRTLDFFPLAESWLVNSNFPRASCMQGEKFEWIFGPRFEVHKLISVYPKGMKLGQMTNLNVIFHAVVSVLGLVKIWITSAHVRDLMAPASANGLGTIKTSKKWQFQSRPRTEQWPRQTASGDLVVFLQLVFA